MIPLAQHQIEIQRNRLVWQKKPILGKIYARFYAQILQLVDSEIAGPIVEIGSGIGNLKEHLPQAICTDLFPNPWLDMVCNAYEMPFKNSSVSHLILFDVFHHLQAPMAFLKEAGRVLAPSGRVILFEPYISLCSFPVFACLHREPVAWRKPIDRSESPPQTYSYYAAQGNATRLFFPGRAQPDWNQNWEIFHAKIFCSFSYLLSGGFSRPAFYPQRWLESLQTLDAKLSRWPRLFGARCLIGLQQKFETQACS